ncbi:MAG: cytosolic protein [Solirubrobacteraceae bacterium]|nr:cytosolic protein [Solirubrobacteraceae bacterium]
MADEREHPIPSDRARELVRGAVDYHIHIAPDFVARRITDIELARRCLETGQAGFGLKSHYTSTAERAQVVAEAVPGVTVLGSITLNRAVGGLNPLAVEIAAREGARIVWFPTVSSVNEQHEVLQADPNGKVPVWVRFELSLREAGLACEPVPVVDDRGELLPEAHEVLDVIARHDMVLCTGHLSRDEIFTLVDAAVDHGVRQIVVTHPEFPSQNVSPADQVKLAEKGALLERCFTTTYTGKAPWERFFEATRAVGAENTLWSTDLGQRFNPPVEDGMALMADRFLEAGFSEEEVRTMAVTNTRRIAGLEALSNA